MNADFSPYFDGLGSSLFRSAYALSRKAHPINMQHRSGRLLLLGRMPKRTHTFQHPDQLRHIFCHAGHVISVQPPGKQFERKKPDHTGQGIDAGLSARFKIVPVFNMLFRPEEIHGTSGIGKIIKPISERYRYISHYTFRIAVLDLAVFHLHPYRRTAIQTGRIDLYCFSRKKPADRQRFESSLGEPFLLAVNGDSILGREVAEGRK